MKLWGEKSITNPKQRNTVAIYSDAFDLLGTGYYAPNLPEYSIKLTETGYTFFAVLVDALGCPRAMLRLPRYRVYSGDTFKLKPPPDLVSKVNEHEKAQATFDP
jgi:hypothetical protein